MEMKQFLFILSCASVISCSGNQTARMLKELDGLVEDRLEIYAEYEAGLQGLKDSLALAVSLDEKWVLADRLYDSYTYFSLDSALEYVGKQKLYASSLKQSCLTVLNEVQIMTYRHDEAAAEALFLSLDTLKIRQLGLLREYCFGGVVLYSNIKANSNHLPRYVADEKLSGFRRRYFSVDSTSSYAHRMRALLARENGDYDTSLRILDSLASVTSNVHEQAFIAYNQAYIYERLNDTEKRIQALIRSAKNDIRGAVRTYLSLYNLALNQYEDNSLKRANLYISANMTDAIAGGFNTRMINAGTTQMIIAEATRKAEAERVLWLLTTLCSFLVLFILIFILFIKNVRHSRRLKEVKNMLLDMNSQLKTTNSDLKLANRIKESYVFSYMELSVNYLKKLEDSRREVRSIAKTEGLDAVLKFLRSPSYIYEEYKLYYKVFDEAFLGIFPDFISNVNALLEEQARFPLPDDPVLCTELRLLAAIRLGITESGKIATFLNCAPTTVYTYRARLKRAAICRKDEFETLISMA